MRMTEPRLAGFAARGFAYGLVLGCLGWVAAGAGHGTYVLLGLASSPCGLLRKDVMEVGGTAPGLWCGLGLLLGLARSALPFRVLFVLAMLAHYVALPFILSDPKRFGDWAHVPRVAGLFALAVLVYVVGQVGLWTLFIRALRRPRIM